MSRYNRTITYGSGNNTVSLGALEEVRLTDSGGTNKYTIGNSRVESGVEESSITLSGANTLTITGRESGVEESTLTLNGKATVSITAGEEAVEDSVLTFKGSGNKLTVSGRDEAVSESRLIFSGQGNDTISLNGKTALEDSTLSVSSGNNNITLSGTTALKSSSITLGSGNDTLSVTGSVTKNSNINTGAGSDKVALSGALSSSTIHTGAGNDVISLTQAASLQKNGVLQGGAGTDTLDISGRSSTSLAQVIAQGAAVRNVEVISMNGGSANTVHISSAGLARFSPETLSSGSLKGQSIMRVTGSSNDKVTFDSSEKWSVVNGSHSHDGVSYTLWKSAAGKQVLVQTGLATSGGSTSGSSGSGSTGTTGTGSGTSNGTGGSTTVDTTVNKTVLRSTTLDYSAKSGDLNVTVSGQSGISVRSSALKLGSGNDQVKLTGRVDTASTIQLGAGDDTLNITGAVYGKLLVDDDSRLLDGTGWTSHVNFTAISAGNGNDRITIGGKVENGVDLDLGNGANTLTLNSDAEYVRITGGSGKDSLTIRGEAENLIVNLKGGANTMVFNDDVDDSTLQTQTGADNITVKGSFERSSLSTGSGNDRVALGEVENSTIDLGAGNDTITIGSMESGSILGGAGSDTLILQIDSASSPFSSRGEFSGLFTGSKSNARGFENLILDLEDNSRDNLVLTQQQINNLRKVASSNGANAKANLDLWIEGDTASGKTDSVTIKGGAGEYSYSGTATNNGLTFNHYATDDGLDLYIQQSLLVTFG